MHLPVCIVPKTGLCFAHARADFIWLQVAAAGQTELETDVAERQTGRFV